MDGIFCRKLERIPRIALVNSPFFQGGLNEEIMEKLAELSPPSIARGNPLDCCRAGRIAANCLCA
jgi:hypothetical protein